VGPELLEEVRKMTEDYRNFRAAEGELRQCLDELLAELENILQARTDAGRQRYDRLVTRQKDRKASQGQKKGGKKK